jgi:hypothetical protein
VLRGVLSVGDVRDFDQANKQPACVGISVDFQLNMSSQKPHDSVF